MPKPLTTGGITLTQTYGSVAEELKRRIGDAQAAQAGPPVSEEIVPATEELAVDAWNARNPEATDEAMLQLAQQKYQEHLAAGMPPDVAQRATAEDLTHYRYGQRLKLYTYGQVGFKDQVAEAKRLAKLAARKTTPPPPTPPPSMPSSVLTNLQSTPGLAEQLGIGAAAPAMPAPAMPAAPTPMAPPAPMPGMALPPGPMAPPTSPTAAPMPPPTPGGY